MSRIQSGTLVVAVLAMLGLTGAAPTPAQDKKPNILFIMG
jgi:hypothetical protein